jgi:hypothetical protein
MRKPLILNEILHRKNFQEQNKYLKMKLCNVKPRVNSNCPESLIFSKSKFNKINNRNNINIKNSDEKKENTIFYKKISINKQGNNIRKLYKPIFEFNNIHLNYYKKEELMDLAKENYNIYQRLNSKNSSYTLKYHLKDYEKAQYYKKNHCKYPSIDFYRTSKSQSLFNSIFNYCTFNNYDNINNEFYNEYNKKKSSINIYQNKNNKERQSKINNFVKNHYKLKKYYEDKKKKKENKEQNIKNEDNYLIEKTNENNHKKEIEEDKAYLPLLIDKIQYDKNE